MTGKEAWSIIAPLLAAHMNHYHGDIDDLDEAYVLTFGALNEFDKRRSENAIRSTEVEE